MKGALNYCTFWKSINLVSKKEDIITKEGIDDQNDDNDIDEPQNILEDVDNNKNYDDDMMRGLEH